MSRIQFVHLDTIAPADLVALMNLEPVGRYLPLLTGPFSLADAAAFLQAKQRMWDDHGYGPWAFLIDGTFAGWGGLQPEQGDADMALVLHPNYWGWGRRIFTRVRDQAFSEMGLPSFTVLLPPSRRTATAVTRLGFVKDGELRVGAQVFLRFRLHSQTLSPSPATSSTRRRPSATPE